MKYRKKPVVIEAFKYNGDLKCIDGIYYIPDWAIEGTHHLYPCKPDIFEETYELAGE